MPRYHAVAVASGQTPIRKQFTPEEEIARDVEEALAEAERPAREAMMNRNYEKPSVEEQLEIIAKNGIDSWKAQMAAIDAKYPIPE